MSFTACDEEIGAIFDADNGGTLVAFASPTADLPIEINSTGTLTVPINVTTRSSSDRTFMVSVVDGSTANPNAYSFSNQVIVPAGQFTGDLVISGVDDMVETTPESLILSISGGDSSGPNITINVFQVCPVPETFATGMYLLEADAPVALFGSQILQPGTVFNVTSSGLTRSFNTIDFAADLCGGGPAFDFNISLVCNEVVVPSQPTGGCNCGGDNSYDNGSANGIYDPNDDSELTFQFTRTCGGNVVENTYRLVRQ